MYNKLFTKILDSSIWLEPTPTRIVWLTIIAAMDETGFVQFASVANLAHRAIVPLGEAEKAVKCLEEPDPASSDPENDGRRIERVPGGWMVLNSEKYRGMATKAVIQEQTRERVRQFRARKKVKCNAPVTQGNESVTPSEAEADKKIGASRLDQPAVDPVAVEFVQFWTEYPRKVGKRKCEAIWRRLKPPLIQCVSAITVQKQSEQWRKDGGTMIPHPSTWLNEGRWEDGDKIETAGRSPRPVKAPPADPPEWAAWRDWNYPNATKTRPFAEVDPQVQREFNNRNQ